MPLGTTFEDELRRALQLRRIQQGTAMLRSAEGELAGIDPQTANAASLLLLIAQWVDVGYRDHSVLDGLLARFPNCARKTLSVQDYLRLRMVEGFCAFSSGELDRAIGTLEFVLRAQRDLPDEALAALAHFWKGRAHRKKGEYEASLVDIASAREFAQSSRDPIFTAVIQIQESWLLFQKGQHREALRLLAESESVLKATDHWIALGNIESARGRIVRRAGEYDEALEHFIRSIEIYARGDPQHVNLARALVNCASTRRLLGHQIRRKLDSLAKSRDSASAMSESAGAGTREALRVRHQQLYDSALQEVERAREIYDIHGHRDGIGNVAFTLGYLHLDLGDIDRALTDAAEAYRIGEAQNDHILMARARILSAAIENAHVEEQIGEGVDIAVHAANARQYSDEAWALALSTENRRLLAGASIARGMTAANDFFQDWELAQRCAAEATSLCGPGENDHLIEDLAALKTRVMRAWGINDRLRGWSEGFVGSKTFQQITEEFAEIVIPKVWLREDKKVSRVAACLSISPKKVRRILRNAGLVPHN
ncbi:MAG TPA: tetratricopeptide repeat protein [Terracidiphilus sp.]|nr:tetratricopeptide repeat protein [Terracidiphilus sp.]